MNKKLYYASAVMGTIISMACIFAACSGDVNGDTYKASFNYNYPDCPSPIVVEADEDGLVEPPKKPTRDNYKFTQWYYEAECSTKVDFEYALERDSIFYAGWERTAYLLTFDANYAGSTITTQSVAIDATPIQPSNPVRTDYIFDGWYIDVQGTSQFDFSKTLTQDTTVYGKWSQSSGDTVTVNYNYNYSEGGIYYSSTLNKGKKPQKPGNPQREGYYFAGWFAEASCTTPFAFNAAVNENTEVYACWLRSFTMEAEYTDLDGKNGSGYSGEASGNDLICNDRNGKLGESVGMAAASNGYFVASLYQENLSIDFAFKSDKAVNNAVLELRLSVEYFDKVLNPSLYAVEVNGVRLNYAEIKLDNAVKESDMQEKGIRPFQNYLISTSVNLKEGDNIIKLIAINDIDRGGTMYADAPAIDCIYIHTDADLSWTDHKDNLVGRI